MATTTACGVLRTPSSAAFWKRLRGGFLRVCSACARKGLAEFAPPRNARCLLVLAGLPGSGKTNLALEIEGQRGQYAWERVCQDELGRRSKCKEAVRRALRDGRRGVVVDRTNLDAKQRCHWVELAREAAAEGEGSPVVTIALAIDVGLDTCLSRVNERQDHPSLPPSKAGDPPHDFFSPLLFFFFGFWLQLLPSAAPSTASWNSRVGCKHGEGV